MKFSVSSYSFSSLLRKKEHTQADCIRLAAEMGFDAIEFASLDVPEGMTPEAYISKLCETAQENHIIISAFMFHLDFLTNNYDEELAHGKKLIDYAKLLGVSLVRHDVAPARSPLPFSASLPVFARACRALADYAAEKGIINTVENHGYYLQKSERLEKLYEAVDHPNFGLLVDFGNFLCDDDNPPTAVSRLAPYARLAHAKDFFVKPASAPYPGRNYTLRSNSGKYLRPTIIGNGDVDVYHCLAAMKSREYTGYVTVEFEGMEDCLEAITLGRENLEKYCEDLQL